MGYYELNLQRKREIEEGLLALMQEMPYDQITVKDLTEKLHMARKTFYHYFPNKQTCLESLADRLIFECNLFVLRTAAPDNTAAIYESQLRFWMEHRVFLKALIDNRKSGFFLNRVLRYLEKEEKNIQQLLSTPQMQYDEDILFFYLSGQIHLLLKWCSEGFTVPLEEMVRKNMRLLHEPLVKLV